MTYYCQNVFFLSVLTFFLPPNISDRLKEKTTDVNPSMEQWAVSYNVINDIYFVSTQIPTCASFTFVHVWFTNYSKHLFI